MALALAATGIVVLALLGEVLFPRVGEAVARVRARRHVLPPVSEFDLDPGRERRAEARARQLLKSCVNDEEWEMYRDLGFIRVWGTQPSRPGALLGSGRGGEDEGARRDRRLRAAWRRLEGFVDADADPGPEVDGDGVADMDREARPAPRPGGSARAPADLPAAEAPGRPDATAPGELPGADWDRPGAPHDPRSARRRPRVLPRRGEPAPAWWARRLRDARGEGGAPRRGRDGEAPYAYLVYPHKPVLAYVPQTGRLLNEYCVEFPDETRPYGSPRLPDSDDVLAKWMALTGDEARLIGTANMHLPGRQIDPRQVRRDLWRLRQWEQARARAAAAPAKDPRVPAS